jgi:hypothetical protein
MSRTELIGRSGAYGGRRILMGDYLCASFSFLMRIVRVSRFDLDGNCQ